MKTKAEFEQWLTSLPEEVHAEVRRAFFSWMGKQSSEKRKLKMGAEGYRNFLVKNLEKANKVLRKKRKQ